MLRRTLDRFKAEKERRAITALPSRFTRHRCAVTGLRWFTEWRVSEADGLYRRHGIIPSARDPVTKRRAGKAGTAQDPSEGKFDMSEFDWTNIPCPWCGDNSLQMHCPCGEIVCGGRSLRNGRGQRVFVCDEKCGKRFPVGGDVTQVAGDTANNTQQKRLTHRPAKSLPAPARALPGRRNQK